MDNQRMRKRKMGSVSKRYLQELAAADCAKLFEEFSREIDTELKSNEEEMKRSIKFGKKLKLSKSDQNIYLQHQNSVTPDSEFLIRPQDERYIARALGSDEIQIPIQHEGIKLENITSGTSSPILLQDKDFVFPDNIAAINGEQLEEIDESHTQPILAAIRELSNVVSEQKNVMDKILKRMENIENKVKMLYYGPTICHLPTFPLKSAEEVDQLEKSLENDDIYAEMVTFVSQIGGTDLKSMVRRVLRRLLTNELAISYSWRGQQQNLAFGEKVALISALKAGIQQNFACSEIEIEVPLREWLRYARKRCDREIMLRQKRIIASK